MKRTIVLFEFSTADNFRRKRLMEKKVDQYQSVERFKDYFKAEPMVVFVLEAPRYEVEEFARENKGDSIYYTDLESFMNVVDDQMRAPIYIWGHDGVSYALKAD